MDPQMSPPKRMTRARAAKVGDSSAAASKPTKIVTAAAKAKTTSTTTARSTATSTKRKTRADEAEEGGDDTDELAQPEAPATKTRTRGRPKKAAEPEPEPAPAPARTTRTRAKKVVVQEPSKEEPAPKPTTRATRATRKPAAAQPETSETEPEAKKPATRTRASATGATRSTAAKSATVKKSVKFEEPEKENIAPPEPKAKRAAAAKAETTTTGLRAKPVRRAAVGATVRASAATAGTRAAKPSSAESETKQYEKPTPLSPKKVTQMAMHNRATTTKNHNHNDYAESEDELAATDREDRPLTKPAAKIRGAGAGTVKLPMPRPAAPTRPSDDDKHDDETTTTTNPSVDLQPTLLGSSCRRPPQSPWKDAMKTPAKKAEGVSVPVLSQSAIRPPASSRIEFTATDLTMTGTQPPQSTFKTSLLASPAKRLGVGSPIKGVPAIGFGSQQLPGPSPLFKSSLMMSPPKRVQPSSFGATSREVDLFGRTPVTKPTLLATPLHAKISGIPEVEDMQDEEEDDGMPDSPSRVGRLPFPGRLSAVLPRSADPALVEEGEQMRDVHEEDGEHEIVPEELDDPELTETEEEHGHREVLMAEEVFAAAVEEQVELPVDEDKMDLDDDYEVIGSYHEEREKETTPPASPQLQKESGFFSLREKDLKPAYEDGDSDEEDELGSSGFQQGPATPCPAAARTPSTRLTGRRSTAKRARTDDKFGFTPLVGQLSSWGGNSSPLKNGMSMPESPGSDILSQNDSGMTSPSKIPVSTTGSPMKNGFFEEAMSGQASAATNQDDLASPIEPDVDASMAGVLMPEFDDITPTHEDVQLAAEAHEMSLLEPEQVEEHIHHDDSLSEASQEYGDENEIPIDPSLLIPPVTPQRNLRREFHTVTRVPLKPADDSTPRQKPKRRGHTISKLPVTRPTQGMQRNATVISYSPTKQQSVPADDGEPRQRAVSAPPVTPKSEAGWSNVGTPARTPRRDLNPALLRGAVVFVDVHTSEGADASGVFVELLSQMGARCVKSWSWNPSSPDESGGGHSKIGITHVVYKDGGKRTLEKVRESGGVVQCVGVSWVLDCEKENEWMDEAPYYIDTTLIPRGGARRRKSMEPKSLANLNGQVVATTTPNTSTTTPSSKTAPSTPAPTTTRRRDSALWIRTPEDQTSSPEDHDISPDNTFLTPLPKTPAPEAIARYAANVSLASTPTSSPSSPDEEDEEDRKARMMTRTCPPKSTSAYAVLGEGVLTREKDEGVLMRLMAARRKSLQFAPKVGSPLARAWKGE